MDNKFIHGIFCKKITIIQRWWKRKYWLYSACTDCIDKFGTMRLINKTNCRECARVAECEMLKMDPYPEEGIDYGFNIDGSLWGGDKYYVFSLG